MKKKRNIIEIDEEKCTGCGQCILACAEGALKLVDGKAKLVGEVYCDGLGACIGECPEGALTITQREADDFDEKAVEELLHGEKAPENKEPALACGCPSAAAMTFERPACECDGASAGAAASQLSHFPIKLQLLNPAAPFLKGAELLLLADCAAAAYPDLHSRLLRGRAVAMGCPKLDDADAHIQRLADILKHSGLAAITIVQMEVPCCGGLVHITEKALEASGVRLPVKRIIISRDGKLLSENVIHTS